jgi:prepilin-type N-terminal cleavage/methylation domain-containing protein
LTLPFFNANIKSVINLPKSAKGFILMSTALLRKSKALLRNRNGFTLIEIIIAVTIVGVVFGIVISSAAAIQRSGRNAQRQSDLTALQSALQQYYADQHFYPQNPVDLTDETEITSNLGNPITPPPSNPSLYLKTIPKEPLTNTVPYIYKAFNDRSLDDTTPCSNEVGSPDKCQFYILCAKMENTDPVIASCGGAYNYQVTPL